MISAAVGAVNARTASARRFLPDAAGTPGAVPVGGSDGPTASHRPRKGAAVAITRFAHKYRSVVYCENAYPLESKPSSSFDRFVRECLKVPTWLSLNAGRRRRLADPSR